MGQDEFHIVPNITLQHITTRNASRGTPRDPRASQITGPITDVVEPSFAQAMAGTCIPAVQVSVSA